MREDGDLPETAKPQDVQPDGKEAPGTRRAMLRIGALGAATIFTVRPGFAQTTVQSALTCTIPLPLTADAGKKVDKDGNTYKNVPKGTTAWSFPTQPLKGEDVKNAVKYNTTIPGTEANQTLGYRKYIEKNITSGKPGYTCYASLLNPNRK